MCVPNSTVNVYNCGMKSCEKEPPLKWFCAIGRRDRGFLTVVYSDELRNLYPELDSSLENYCHLPQHIRGSAIGSKPHELFEKWRQAGRRVYEITGFRPKVITERRRQLSMSLYTLQELPEELREMNFIMVD